MTNCIVLFLALLPAASDYAHVYSEVMGDSPAPAFTPGREVVQMIALADVCVREQWVGPGEWWSWLAGGESFKTVRAARLAVEGCPRIETCRLFPPEKDIYAYWEHNRRYRQYLITTWWSWNEKEQADIRKAVAELDELAILWDHAWYAQRSGRSIVTNRRGLKTLHDTIGPKDFWDGKLPPMIPQWALERWRE